MTTPHEKPIEIRPTPTDRREFLGQIAASAIVLALWAVAAAQPAWLRDEVVAGLARGSFYASPEQVLGDLRRSLLEAVASVAQALSPRASSM